MGDRHNALGKLYDAVWTDVDQAVDKADPEGLLTMGGPSDEYDDAVTHLTRLVLKGEEINQNGERWFLNQYGLASSGADALAACLRAMQARVLRNE